MEKQALPFGRATKPQPELHGSDKMIILISTGGLSSTYYNHIPWSACYCLSVCVLINVQRIDERIEAISDKHRRGICTTDTFESPPVDFSAIIARKRNTNLTPRTVCNREEADGKSPLKAF
jgi:hypothetical protein